MSAPLISCLTVTEGRLRLLKEAIWSYLDQTHPARELVIVTAAGPWVRHAISRFLSYLGKPADIRLVGVDEPAPSLGALRNVALDHARGEIVCQWDDDDLAHPDRIRAQFEMLVRSEADACFLNGHLQLFERQRELYWVDWAHEGRLEFEERLVPQTVMFRRDDRYRYPEVGDRSGPGEDCAIRAQLLAGGRVAELPDAGELYLYRFHGSNTLGEDHHRHIGRFGARPGPALRRDLERLTAATERMPLPLPCRVVGRDGETVHHVHR